MIKITTDDMICPKCGRTSVQKMVSFDKKGITKVFKCTNATCSHEWKDTPQNEVETPKKIKGRLTFISTYRRRIFKIMDDNGKEYLCGLYDESQWDRLYDYLDTRIITVFVVGEEEDKLLVKFSD